MDEKYSYFQCEAVRASAPEIICDFHLGDLLISTVCAEPEPKPKRAPLILNDPELGPLVLGPAPAMQALPHRTGPPCFRSTKIAGGR